MIDYKYKSELLNNGLYDLYDLWLYAQNSYYLLYTSNKPFDNCLIPYLNMDICDYLDNKSIRECARIFDSRRQRTRRLKDKVSTLITKSSLFVTMTFTDDILETTSDETRRVYITRFLKQFNVPVIANKDFGGLNNREHYHAIVQIDKIDFNLYKYGIINAEKIRNCDNDYVRLSKYISKLTNHAIKETTKRSSLIYINMKLL